MAVCRPSRICCWKSLDRHERSPAVLQALPMFSLLADACMSCMTCKRQCGAPSRPPIAAVTYLSTNPLCSRTCRSSVQPCFFSRQTPTWPASPVNGSVQPTTDLFFRFFFHQHERSPTAVRQVLLFNNISLRSPWQPFFYPGRPCMTRKRQCASPGRPQSLPLHIPPPTPAVTLP